MFAARPPDMNDDIGLDLVVTRRLRSDFSGSLTARITPVHCAASLSSPAERRQAFRHQSPQPAKAEEPHAFHGSFHATVRGRRLQKRGGRCIWMRSLGPSRLIPLNLRERVVAPFDEVVMVVAMYSRSAPSPPFRNLRKGLAVLTG